MSAATRAVGVLVALVAALGIGGLTRLPTSLGVVEEGTLRLSWRLQGERIEECRALSEEEIAALPAHMRRSEECTGRYAEYRLTVEVDDRVALLDTIAPSGARGDRPLYVLRDLPIAPGTHDVEVAFEPLDPDLVATGRREWAGSVTVVAAEIALLTLNDDASALVLRERGR